jgi:hypothetical protein
MLAQYGDGGGGGVSAIVWIIYFAVIVLQIAGMWRVFEKAGQPGWAALIPFYNGYILAKVAGRPGWWWVLLIIPLVNFVVWIILCVDAAKNFAKGTGYGIGLALLPFVFFPVLGFGPDTYRGSPAATGGQLGAPPPPPMP